MFCVIKKDTEDQVKDLKELLDSGAKLQIVMEFSETIQRFTNWYVSGSVTQDTVCRLDGAVHDFDLINMPSATVMFLQHQPNNAGLLGTWVRSVKLWPDFNVTKALTSETLEEAKLAVRDGIIMLDDGRRVFVTHPNISVEVIRDPIDVDADFTINDDPDEDEDPNNFKDPDEDED